MSGRRIVRLDQCPGDAAGRLRPRRDPNAARLSLPSARNVTSLSKLARSLAEEPRAVTLFGVPEGHDAATIGGLFAESGGDICLHVCRDDGRMSRFAAALVFYHPESKDLRISAYDFLHYYSS